MGTTLWDFEVSGRCMKWCLFMKLMSAWKAKTFTEACRYGVLVVRTYLDDVWIRCLSVKSMRIKVTSLIL